MTEIRLLNRLLLLLQMLTFLSFRGIANEAIEAFNVLRFGLGDETEELCRLWLTL
jgi:hypothetical protein